jgi:membrane-anchored glycerophosphoryl diester phosphodiesterase (GDPDase)
MRLHHLQQQQVLLLHALQIFVIIMVSVSKVVTEQAYNVIVQQAGQVHDVNTVSSVFTQFPIPLK